MSNWRYTLSTIAEAVGGRVLGDGALEVNGVAIDSRGSVPPTSLFVALGGPRHDGHHHIKELTTKGVRGFLVNEQHANTVAGLNVVVVKDTLAALQQFAAWHRSHFNIPVIGITGSNGKTIVKEWLWQMLHHEENIVRSPGSWNSQVGVPLSVLQMGPQHTLGIFEAGISKPGEMEKLEPIIRPTVGVLTNIGDAHDEGFGGDKKLKSAEKSKLFSRSRYQTITSVAKVHEAVQVHQQRRVMTCDTADRSALILAVLNEERRDGHSSLDTISGGTNASRFELPFDDDASVMNALTCIAVCRHLGKSTAWINERLAQLVPVDMRMRTVQGAHGSTLIDDSYSLDRTSLISALDHLRRVAHGRPMIALLSDLAESGDDDAVYPEVAQALRQIGVHQLIGIGPRISGQRPLFGANARFHPDVDAMLAHEDPKAFTGAVILIKGARRFGFERIVQRWQQQVHGTELEIDLEAVRHNLNHYRSLLAPGVRTMAMVKAFGYGSGALELARLFEHERVHYLGVAYADEGIELRSHGITMPIMVMNPEPVAMETLHRFRLEAEVYDMRSLTEAIGAAQQMPDAPPVHIKLDTGMHRLGFTEEELPVLLDALRGQQALKVASILSHMVGSEDAALDDFTREQIAVFTRMADAIDVVLGYKPLRHMANTAGIARWPQAHFDMVRVGIGLHGIGADAKETTQLQHTVTLRTVVAQLKQLHAGDSVGYNRRGQVMGERTIATLPIGYADGLSRRLGNGVGCVWVNDRRAPIIGNVCMDMCMVDVTDAPCTVGDVAVVFDARHPVSEVATAMGTIPYEVLTGISQRVKRVYVRNT
ncbi:MAG: bifunctional UDP-N-acetylmuramoyl-tripeptide:D-alanyl-D-alanine ligase/alanine racemase [Flavobacteriales bacterium]|nr:MAG: bifunctional UDP-N-acetylmuramoyl-tripeptide:D-alanyl-D-alanine ligase/alanine racemase [Flavobacteriales bacterium]